MSDGESCSCGNSISPRSLHQRHFAEGIGRIAKCATSPYGGTDIMLGGLVHDAWGQDLARVDDEPRADELSHRDFMINGNHGILLGGV